MTTRPDDDTEWRAAARAVLTHYACEVVGLERVAQGLVNLTIKVLTRDGPRLVLQRLHPVFGAGVNDNIAKVTAHLAARGLLTPRLVPTRDGALEVVDGARVWRVLSYIDGRAFDRLPGPSAAAAAGDMLARFHVALADFSGTLTAERPPIHDFARHRARLDERLQHHATHRLHGAVLSALAMVDALDGAGHLAQSPAAPRTVHGDPKISNILFDADGRRALCMIDLDTVARMPLALELGDAFRSWCNPQGEDAAGAVFELDLFAAALAAYAAVARDLLTAAEIAAIVPATLEIHLELAARFLADSLDESYFGWDATRYASRGEHNLARAHGQLRAAASLAARRVAAERVVLESFKGE